MIEGDTTKNKEFIGKFKDDSNFLLNEVESTFNDKPMVKYMQKQKYEQVVSECKKYRSLIKTFVGRNTTVLPKK